jgi:hypothetical protein
MESMLAARLHAFGLLLVRMRNPRQLSVDREPFAAAFLEGIDEFIVAAVVLVLVSFPRPGVTGDHGEIAGAMHRDVRYLQGIEVLIAVQ